MKTKYLFITNNEWFDNTRFKNPIHAFDYKLKEYYPEFFEANYDLHILATEEPTKEEREFFAYNDYRDKYGISDISILKDTALKSQSKNVFLNGFNQEHFEYLAKFIKDKTEILYLFKCPRINDLSLLS